jgi:hypothetical protein
VDQPCGPERAEGGEQKEHGERHAGEREKNARRGPAAREDDEKSERGEGGPHGHDELDKRLAQRVPEKAAKSRSEEKSEVECPKSA